MCSGILRRASQYRRSRVYVRPLDLCSDTCRLGGVGVVCMGYVTSHGTRSWPDGYLTASVNFLDGTKIEQQRILLAVYPLL